MNANFFYASFKANSHSENFNLFVPLKLDGACVDKGNLPPAGPCVLIDDDNNEMIEPLVLKILCNNKQLIYPSPWIILRVSYLFVIEKLV